VPYDDRDRQSDKKEGKQREGKNFPEKGLHAAGSITVYYQRDEP
jgi:hypothetical protein